MAGVTYFLAPMYAPPSGGIRKLYACCDHLVAAGRDAAVVHEDGRFRCDWFANDTPILGAAEVMVDGTDLLVYPEEWAALCHSLAPDVEKVIFNQNPFRTLCGDLGGLGYETPMVRVVTVSEYAERYIKWAFPNTTVDRLRYAVDPALYFRTAKKRQQICYMPRKRPAIAREVIEGLRRRGIESDWSIVPIDGMSQEDAARVLRESSIFMSLSEAEGFGLPAAEALACGTLVVGFSGYGGDEFFGDGTVGVADGDLVGLADAMTDVTANFDPSLLPTADISAAIFDRYSPAAERADSLALFTPQARERGRSAPLGRLETSIPRWKRVGSLIKQAAMTGVRG